MQDFFIDSFEALVSVLVVLLSLGVLGGAGVALFDPDGGILPMIAILVGGFIYVVLIAGVLYLAIGIYQNTKRTADAVEKLANR